MAWLLVFNGVVAHVDHMPGYEKCDEISDQLNALDAMAGFKVWLYEWGGLMVYPEKRGLTTTVSKDGEFSSSLLSPSVMDEDCGVWPIGPNATPPSDEEQAACLVAAQIAIDWLSKEPGVEIGPLSYGFHVHCFD